MFNSNEIYRLVLLFLSRLNFLNCQLIALSKNFRNLFMSYITRMIQSIEFIVVIITKNNILLGYNTLFYVIFSFFTAATIQLKPKATAKRTNDQRYQMCPNSQYYGVYEFRRTISRGVRFTNFRLSEGYTTDHKTCNPSRRVVAHLTESISCVPITFDDVSMRKLCEAHPPEIPNLS